MDINGYQWYLPRPRSLRRDLCLASGTLLADAWQSIPDNSSTAMLKTSENHQKSTDSNPGGLGYIGILCDAVWCQDPLQYVRLLRVWFPVRGRAMMPRCHPSFGKHWLAAKVQGFRQADGNAMGLAWENLEWKAEGGNYFFSRGTWISHRVCWFATCVFYSHDFKFSKDSSGFLAKPLHAVPGGAGRSKNSGQHQFPRSKAPQKTGAPTQDNLSLFPRCGSGKIKQRVGCLPPRGFSLVLRWWWDSSGTNLHRQWASGWFWYIVLIGEITTQRGWNIKYHQISSNQNSWWQCYNMLQCSYDVDIVMFL